MASQPSSSTASKRRRRVLAIDDEPAMTEWLKMVIEAEGYEVRTALIGTRGEEIFKQWRPDVVVTDLMLPDLDGVQLLRRLKEVDPSPEVIVISGQGTIARAVEAGQAGAFFFLEKPVSQDGLMNILGRAIDRTQERAEHQQLKDQIRGQYSFANIVGQSKKMKELFELVESVAASDANILIQGENGTGKELIANAIHYNSNRVKGPFIKINCAAIPKDLIESELFGYKKAHSPEPIPTKVGLFEMAEGGSLLLDEIGEMPPYLQTKLLRVLQEREYRPIGSDRIVHVDFRLICATNIDLDTALRKGSCGRISISASTRSRSASRPFANGARTFHCSAIISSAKFNQRYQKSVRAISPAAYHLLIRNRWAGNVRELENAIERAVLVCKTGEITPNDLPETIREEGSPAQEFTIPPHRTLAEIEKMAIVQTLQRTNWNKQEAAQILGLYRPTLYSKMKKHDIKDQRAAQRAAAASSTTAG
jgi:DNA-binding NtrC family response regulator